ncbi:SusC/RagA family TonB-linked outer membrane protein [Flavobacterium palustre]|uniref:SusC/RagA family TonB-linked outer membrane protein n=1 Tax=Flavobacterium palustre TaxID=1476463 RepID=A0ABQ1HLB9_9FLAO|nr:TonB-dependent receptor [Flavobacterium palustre]GGA82285.1 SusC/RagA family TonB-linked outer membrane protein [Flavobacterium palustre]
MTKIIIKTKLMTMKKLKLKYQPLDKVLKQLFVGVFVMMAPVIVQAQSKTITGSVNDDKKDPLPGVTVLVRGTKIAVTTDFDGKFKINATPTDQLAFSYIGFENATITVGDKATINVTLKSTTSSLDEVVVIGYGSVNKKDLTGSVASVSMADINKAPVRSFDEALAGRVAGVQVTSDSGQPGAGVNIVIRGNNSVTQANSPLYVIDGFIVEGADNNAINPSDIESMQILKDASATAIYGARGANGVIVITTKKGKKGKTVFSFSSSIGVQNSISKMDLMNPYEFLKYQLELNPALTSVPRSPTEIYLSDGKTLDYYKTQKGIDWQGLVTRPALFQNNDFSARGGTNKLKYSFSGSTSNQDGVLLNSNYKRYQGRAVIDYNITDKLKIGVNANYSHLEQSGINPGTSTNSATTNIMVSVWGARPILTDPSVLDLLQDPDINGANDYRVNPTINLENLYRLNTTKSTIVNSYIEYLFTKDLKFKTTFGIRENRLRVESFNNSQTQYGFPGNTNGVNGSILHSNSSNWQNENTLTWNKQLSKKSKLNVLGGFTVQKNDSWSFGQSATQLPNEDLGLAGLDQGVQQRVDSLGSVWTMSSFLGRVDYNYASKYFLTASFRADGSSKFPSKNHWGYFPSAAAAWSFGKENFIKNSKTISEGKLRASYGVTGNNRVGDFDYLTNYFNPLINAYVFDNDYVPGVVPTIIGNSDLKWETTEQLDAGVDLGFFKQRITLTADVYRKITKDLLLRAQLPPSSGFGSAFKNIGSVENKGLELTLTTKNIQTKDFSWTSSANIAFNQNKLLALAEGQDRLESTIRWDNNWQNTSAYIAKIGQPLGLMYGYEWLGTYKDADFDITVDGNGNNVYTLKADVATNGNTRANIQRGDIKYKDQNGDGIVNASDYTVIGRGLPKHTGGFSNNFTYKGFDLNVFFQWSYGNDILNANKLLFEGNTKGQQYLNQFASYENRWTPENSNSDIFRTGGYFGGGYSSAVVEDGSYLRLKTVSLGYNVNSDLVSKWHLKSLRFYVSGQNLITWTKYSGPDPEVNAYSSALTSGFDFSTYPRARTIVFGTNISF